MRASGVVSADWRAFDPLTSVTISEISDAGLHHSMYSQTTGSDKSGKFVRSSAEGMQHADYAQNLWGRLAGCVCACVRVCVMHGGVQGHHLTRAKSS